MVNIFYKSLVFRKFQDYESLDWKKYDFKFCIFTNYTKVESGIL